MAKVLAEKRQRSVHERRKAPPDLSGSELPARFVRMFQQAVGGGKLRRAGDIVSQAGKEGGVAAATPEVLNELQRLHPEAQPAEGPEPPRPDVAPGMHDDIDDEFIRSLAVHLRGAPGPSGLTTDLLRMLCRLECREGVLLCEAIAKLAKRVAEESLPAEFMAAIIACRLVALEKETNKIRPIGIGEALRVHRRGQQGLWCDADLLRAV